MQKETPLPEKELSASLATFRSAILIGDFDYSWSIVNAPKKAERVESALEEILSSRSNLGLDTIHNIQRAFHYKSLERVLSPR